jgi:cob(I)alamin adenosyltransferase
MDEKLPMEIEQPEEERTWRDVAQRWKEIGKHLADLGERLGSAFKEGWDTETVSEEEVKRLKDRLRELGQKMESAADSVVSEAKAPETKAKAKRTVKATREASVQMFGELQESLNEGLQEINKRFDDVVKKRKEKKSQG